MDDAFRVLVFIFTFVLAAPVAAEVSYVTPAQTEDLNKTFDNARAADPAQLLAKSSWTCDMFGMRSKMQVDHGTRLYAFARAPGDQSLLKNSGDSPVGEYAVRDGELRGEDARRGLRDELRVTKAGRLIGKMSLPAQNITVAFAVCTGS